MGHLHLNGVSAFVLYRLQVNIHVMSDELRIALENAAINDVLPLKTARCDAIANLKCVWGSGTSAT